MFMPLPIKKNNKLGFTCCDVAIPAAEKKPKVKLHLAAKD